ncbi:unnamed protein product [Bursaphelenchus xylophilus]|uniref:(pine wood nematode) hypothetical protein n=1 Tax=Bursaphelenchus xylophilus TaxID=6326 RepID=A0A1I7SU15_BURXY|nr:unnamed protein product [Bursaphelenchus xylophilus]CAG9107694.1 unnamed protein product [Bursaphelenchus xylophilus]
MSMNSTLTNESGYFTSPNTTNFSGISDVSQDDKEMEKGEHVISGRLGLLNENKQYIVKMDELKRRLQTPENLNISYINAILRRAKGRPHANRLRNIFKRHGVTVPPNKRTESKATCFTALCEEESLTIVKDVGRVLNEHFPKDAFEKELTRRIQVNSDQLMRGIHSFNNDIQRRQITTGSLQNMLRAVGQTVLEVLETDKTFEYQSNGQTPKNLDPLQKGLWDLNLVTHNFGVRAMMSAVATTTGLTEYNLPAVHKPSTDSHINSYMTQNKL